MPDAGRNVSIARALPCAPAPGEAVIEARSLGFEISGRRLLHDVSIKVRPGALTVILGPNGAGKSLLLRLLHGLVRPTSGKVLHRGLPLDDRARRRQAMVFQRPVLLRRSVASNVRFAMRAAGVSRQDRRLRLKDALARAGLSERANDPARLLSTGQQQRLAIARALALQPEVLFLDEPAANLDPAATLAIEKLTREAHAAGAAVVLVTHDLGQARRLARDVVFLSHGRTLEQAPAEAFFERPASAQARAFLEGRLVL